MCNENIYKCEALAYVYAALCVYNPFSRICYLLKPRYILLWVYPSLYTAFIVVQWIKDTLGLVISSSCHVKMKHNELSFLP